MVRACWPCATPRSARLTRPRSWPKRRCCADCERLATLEDPAKFGPWLCGIASRVCLDWLKSGQARQVSLDAMCDGQADCWARRKPANRPTRRPNGPTTSAGCWPKSRRCPEPYREVILLYYYDDVTYHDVAAMLGVSTATVNARLTKARAMLRERLSGMQR